MVVFFSAEFGNIDKFLLNKITTTNEHSRNERTNTKNNETYVVSAKETELSLLDCLRLSVLK
jgi:hypothetical protein